MTALIELHGESRLVLRDTKQLVRVGLNYKFDRPARSTSRPPMQARYIYFDLRTVTTIPARITDNLLRVGVNYKFDGADIWTND